MKVVCLGSGNVGTHLAKAFKESGAELVQIWSRNLAHAEKLADNVQAEAIDDLGKLDRTADLYLIAINDEAIATVAGVLQGVKGLVVHTSGSTPMQILTGLKNYGVLYPLQTFSKEKSLNFKSVPLCIEAGNAAVLQQLSIIARGLSEMVYEVDSEQRKVLHLAAVFACNFTNHLYYIGQQLLKDNGLNFDLLKPLIEETAGKIQYAMPQDVQTGPAIRGDEETLSRHMGMLEGQPDLREIYTILSRNIKKAR